MNRILQDVSAADKGGTGSPLRIPAAATVRLHRTTKLFISFKYSMGSCGKDF